MDARPTIKLAFVNFFPGFDEDRCRSHVLMDLCEDFDFVFGSDDPDVLIVGCYGQREVRPTRAIKVGYYTENLPPDLENFDYFFGCEYTDLIGHPKYCKRVFGPLMSDLFDGCEHPKEALQSKTRFCNFIYSARVPHRERFFRAAERYRGVSAPGKAMNNCADLASRQSADWQAEKLDYLRTFKFTISFENSRRPGYATEKLFDALRADTVPVYWGDPLVGRLVNPEALVIVEGDWEGEVFPWARFPERRLPYRPYSREPSVLNKAFGRANDWIRQVRALVPYSRGFADAIEQMIELDNDDEAYRRKLAKPRLRPDVLKMRDDYFAFWRRILIQAAARRSAVRTVAPRRRVGA